MFRTTVRNGSEQSYRYVRSANGSESWTPRGGRDSYVQTERTMLAKYDGSCRTCGQRFAAGTQITWSKANGSKHVECPKAAPMVVDTALAQMCDDDREMALSEMANDRQQTRRENAVDEQDQIEAALEEYHNARRAANIANLKVGTYRVEFSGRRDTDSFNLKITADRRNEGSFYFKQAESYEGVGRLWADGRIQLWQNDLSAEDKKRAQEALEILLNAERMGKYGEAYARETGECFRCGRELKVEDSIDRGLGSTCAAKVEAGY